MLVPLKTPQRRITGNMRGQHTAGVHAGWQRRHARDRQHHPTVAERRKLSSKATRTTSTCSTQTTGRYVFWHHQGHDHAVGRAVAAVSPLGGRHRHHEHHAGQRLSARARSGLASGRGALERAAAVLDRGGGVGRAGVKLVGIVLATIASMGLASLMATVPHTFNGRVKCRLCFSAFTSAWCLATPGASQARR